MPMLQKYMYCKKCQKLAPVRKVPKQSFHYCRICKKVVSDINNRIVRLSQEEAHIRGLEVILQRGT